MLFHNSDRSELRTPQGALKDSRNAYIPAESTWIVLPENRFFKSIEDRFVACRPVLSATKGHE
jgi:hypothetical protein